LKYSEKKTQCKVNINFIQFIFPTQTWWYNKSKNKYDNNILFLFMHKSGVRVYGIYICSSSYQLHGSSKRPGVNWLRGETTQYLWLLIITNQRSNQFSLGCHSPFWELCPLKMLRIPKYFVVSPLNQFTPGRFAQDNKIK
jgi:hypothetical protein